MIEIRSVRAGILSIPSCSINKGICAITGPNGSGKTTFLKLLSGIILPLNGTVYINEKSPPGCTIGWVGEYPDRNMLFTRVFDEIASPLIFARIPCREIESTVRKCAENLGISHLLTRNIHGLSSGEKVLVAFGAALIAKPDLLILDETDSHLDDEFCRHLDHIIKTSGIRHVVFSTHRPERMAVADEIIILEEGTIQDHYTLLRTSGSGFDNHMNDPRFWKWMYAHKTCGDQRC